MNTRVKEIGSAIGACGVLLGALLACGGSVNTTVPKARYETLAGTDKAIVNCIDDSYYCVKMMYESCAKLNREPRILSNDGSQQIEGHSYYYNGLGGSRVSSTNHYWMVYTCVSK